MMTKKHFILLAEAIATIADETVRESMFELVACVCVSDNPNFDWFKFKEACNVS